MDTIAAISTAPGASAIGVIRISGDDAFSVLDRVFFPAGRPMGERPDRTAVYGEMRDAKGDVIADVSFVIYIVAYTGSSYDPAVCAHTKAVTFEVDNGIETVCPACKTVTKSGEGEDVKPEEPARFDVAGTNMNLGNELAVNFMFTKALDASKSYTAMIKQMKDGEAVKTTTVAQADWASFNTNLYKVTATVRAMEMADDLVIEIVDEEGTVYNNPYTTSVRAYAEKALASATSSAKMKTLVVDMLNYGAEAQKKFSYNTSDLANATLTAAQKALASGKVTCTDKRVKGENYYGTNLALEDKIELNLFFKNVTTDMYAVISYTNFKGEKISYTVEGKDFVQYSGNIYKVPVDRIVVADAQSLVTVTVYTAKGAVHGTGCDSVESYAARAGENALNEMIMKFAASAKAYLN